MRSFHHWTPRYIKNRLAEIYYRKSFPDHPWLARTANEILASCLKESDIGIEFGSGRSTIWTAKRIKHLTSVEHDESWYRKVQKMIIDNELDNISFHHFHEDKEFNQASDTAYVKIIEQFEPNSLDFALVDGIYRDYCAFNLISRIRPGGMLIIDNVNWYLPSFSYSPDSRSSAQGPKGEIWIKGYDYISQWRTIWTSSCVTDTAIFFKPCNFQTSVQ